MIEAQITKILLNSVIHRDDGPAVIVTGTHVEKHLLQPNGNYYIHNYELKPTYDYNYREIWYNKGIIHRSDGPAIITKNNDGTTMNNWRFNGYPPIGLKKWAEEMDIDLDNLTEYDKTMITLKWIK